MSSQLSLSERVTFLDFWLISCSTFPPKEPRGGSVVTNLTGQIYDCLSVFNIGLKQNASEK